MNIRFLAVSKDSFSFRGLDEFRDLFVERLGIAARKVRWVCHIASLEDLSVVSAKVRDAINEFCLSLPTLNKFRRHAALSHSLRHRFRFAIQQIRDRVNANCFKVGGCLWADRRSVDNRIA